MSRVVVRLYFLFPIKVLTALAQALGLVHTPGSYMYKLRKLVFMAAEEKFVANPR